MYIFKTTNAISFVTVHVYTYIYAYMHYQIIFPSLRAFKFAKSKQKLFGVTRLWVYSTPSIVGFIYIQTYIHTYAHIYHNAYINILYCFLLFLGRIVWAAEHALRQPVVYVDKKKTQNKSKYPQNSITTAINIKIAQKIARSQKVWLQKLPVFNFFIFLLVFVYAR